MKSVTFRVDAAVLERARAQAAKRGTTLDAVVEAFLSTWSADDATMARRHVVKLAEDHTTHLNPSARSLARDDLYEERTRWPRS